jgi:hypothetical protein
MVLRDRFVGVLLRDTFDHDDAGGVGNDFFDIKTGKVISLATD